LRISGSRDAWRRDGASNIECKGIFDFQKEGDALPASQGSLSQTQGSGWMASKDYLSLRPPEKQADVFVDTSSSPRKGRALDFLGAGRLRPRFQHWGFGAEGGTDVVGKRGRQRDGVGYRLDWRLSALLLFSIAISSFSLSSEGNRRKASA